MPSPSPSKISMQQCKVSEEVRPPKKEFEDAGSQPSAKSINSAIGIDRCGRPIAKLWEWWYPEPHRLGRQIGWNLGPWEEQHNRSVALRRLPSKEAKAGPTPPSHPLTLGVLGSFGSAEAMAGGASSACVVPTVAHQVTCGVAFPLANMVRIQAIGMLPTPTLVSKSFLSLPTALVDFSTQPTTMHTQSAQWPPILQHPLPSSKRNASLILNQFIGIDHSWKPTTISTCSITFEQMDQA